MSHPRSRKKKKLCVFASIPSIASIPANPDFRNSKENVTSLGLHVQKKPKKKNLFPSLANKVPRSRKGIRKKGKNKRWVTNISVQIICQGHLSHPLCLYFFSSCYTLEDNLSFLFVLFVIYSFIFIQSWSVKTVAPKYELSRMLGVAFQNG